MKRPLLVSIDIDHARELERIINKHSNLSACVIDFAKAWNSIPEKCITITEDQPIGLANARIVEIAMGITADLILTMKAHDIVFVSHYIPDVMECMADQLFPDEIDEASDSIDNVDAGCVPIIDTAYDLYNLMIPDVIYPSSDSIVVMHMYAKSLPERLESIDKSIPDVLMTLYEKEPVEIDDILSTMEQSYIKHMVNGDGLRTFISSLDGKEFRSGEIGFDKEWRKGHPNKKLLTKSPLKSLDSNAETNSDDMSTETISKSPVEITGDAEDIPNR